MYLKIWNLSEDFLSYILKYALSLELSLNTENDDWNAHCIFIHLVNSLWKQHEICWQLLLISP